MAGSSSKASEDVELSSADYHAYKDPTQSHSKSKTAESSQQRTFLYRLKKLRKKMVIYSRQIKKFNEESLSFNEMDREDSAYMKVDALQKRLLKTWEEFCRVQGMSPEINVKYNSKTFNGTEYEELNKKINRLLDKSMDCFPDYMDVHTVVRRCATKHNLPISSEEQSSLSRRIFQDIIKELKWRRQGDFINHFGSHLTDECKGTADPALDDRELNTMLERQHNEGDEKMAKVIEDFVAKQDTNPQGTQEAAESEDNEKESEKEDSGEQDDLESEGGKEVYESDHSAIAEAKNQDSFEMTLELGRDKPTVQEDEGMDVSHLEEDASSGSNDECDLTLDTSNMPSRSPSPSSEPAINGSVTPVLTAPSKDVGKEHINSCNGQAKKQEQSCDVIVIDD